MNICIVSNSYPNKHSTTDYIFVKKLVDEFSRQGNKCCVISPFNFLHYRGIEKVKSCYEAGENLVSVYRPWYLSFSTYRIFHKIASISHSRAINRAFRMMERSGFKPDAIYCHFWHSGLLGYDYARNNNIPLFVASGESTISMSNTDGHLNAFCDYVKGVVCVSSKNKDESVSLKLTVPEKCLVAPNAINEKVFYKMDKKECRKKLNIPQNIFVIAFVGAFIERKGSMRVAEAINQIDTNDVYSLFLGSGEQNPLCENIIYKRKVENADLPIYLNAADVFVLPTQHEGCCNAIIEAMACGLPIISSDLPFNWDVLNESNSIMINPNDIDSIAKAICLLKDSVKYREFLSQGSLKAASVLTIENRAHLITDFIRNSIHNNFS